VLVLAIRYRLSHLVLFVSLVCILLAGIRAYTSYYPRIVIKEGLLKFSRVFIIDSYTLSTGSKRAVIIISENTHLEWHIAREYDLTKASFGTPERVLCIVRTGIHLGNQDLSRWKSNVCLFFTEPIVKGKGMNGETKIIPTEIKFDSENDFANLNFDSNNQLQGLTESAIAQIEPLLKVNNYRLRKPGAF
jgi:hypothetical protein